LKILTEQTALLGLVLLFAGAIQAAEGPRFYQHVTVSNPAAAVEKLLDEGWSIRGYPPLSMTAPIDWAADPYDDSNWRYQLNAMYPLAPVFQLLAQQYDPALHAFARSVFLDWIAFNLDRDTDHPFRWNDMATGVRASYLAQLLWYEQTYGGEPYLTELTHAAYRHLQELSDPSKLAHSNHALLQLVGIASLCEVLDASECSGPLRYARERYEELFFRQFDVEGMHREHSPEYHLLALKTFDRIEASGLLTLSAKAQKILALARYNLQFLMHPDGGFAEIGDTQAASSRGAASLSEEARWLITSGREGERAYFGVRVFPDSGYGFARLMGEEGWQSYLLLFAGHHSRVHKHQDSGTFEWSDRGRRIVVDSGKWGYDATKERKYVLSSRAHNTIESDGVSYSVGDVPEAPAILDGWTSEHLLGIAAWITLPGRVFDGTFHRALVAWPGEWLVVDDELTQWPGGSHTQWFHFPPEAEVVRTAIGFDVLFPGIPARLSVFSLDPAVEPVAVKGQRRPRLLGWYSPSYHRLVPSWQVGFRGAGWRTHFSTVLRWVDPADDQPTRSSRTVASSALRRLCWSEGSREVGVALVSTGQGWRPQACD
jgi:hypothetical protein